MSKNFNSITTDYGLATILSNFESDYIIHIVKDSLTMKFRPFESTPMPNIVDIYQRNFLDIEQNSDQEYLEKIESVKHDTYEEIINIICSYYDISYTIDLSEYSGDRLYSICRILYDIFVCRFSENFISFIVKYIISNCDSIYSYLEKDENSIKPKEIGQYDRKNYLDNKFILIHANLNTVIYNMTSYDISLNELFGYFLDTKTYNEFSNIFVENTNVFKNHFAIYINDPIYQAGVMTNAKLLLQSETINMSHILNNQGENKNE
jgi:hypothetical protein